MQTLAPQLYLPAHVFACYTGTGGQLVLLDVRRDEYMGLSATQARAMAVHVANWPMPPDAADDGAPLAAERVGRLIERLREKCILSPVADGEREPPPALPTVQSKLVREFPGTRPRVSLADAGRLLLAALRSARSLRLRSLESTLHHVRDRKRERLTARAASSLPPRDSNELRQWVTAFIHLRPLLFGARDHCLFDSLALIEYLALRGAYPMWVFGVRILPFGAHCWVQEGAVVYNDTPEHARSFTPILSI
jgi:hypothetical protein